MHMSRKDMFAFRFLLPLLLLVVRVGATEGDELIGTKPPEWTAGEWINSEPMSLASLRGKVVLIRWWTGPGCPYCSKSADALNRLWRSERERGLVVIGMYHHKADVPLTREHVAIQAERLGFQFPIAIDRDWSTLRRWWLDRGDHRWTSVSFLVDRTGRIVSIHPGGAYREGDADFERFKSAIGRALEKK